MDPKIIWPVAVLLALMATMAATTEASASFEGAQWSDGDLAAARSCNGQVGDCMEPEEELMMDSVASRRQLGAYTDMFISYAALKKNQVPCGQRGASYYNCHGNARANPYRRGCSAITHCKRYTK